MDNKEIIYQTRIHWVVFALPVVMCCISVAFFSRYNLWGSLTMFLLTGLLSIKAVARFLGDQYLINKTKVLIIRQFFYQRLEEIFLDKIEGVYVGQGFLGRLLNYGTVIIVGVGGRKIELTYSIEPNKFRTALEEIREQNK